MSETKDIADALRKYAEKTGRPAFPYDDLEFTLVSAAFEIERLRSAQDAHRETVAELMRELCAAASPGDYDGFFIDVTSAQMDRVHALSKP